MLSCRGTGAWTAEVRIFSRTTSSAALCLNWQTSGPPQQKLQSKLCYVRACGVKIVKGVSLVSSCALQVLGFSEHVEIPAGAAAERIHQVVRYKSFG